MMIDILLAVSDPIWIPIIGGFFSLLLAAIGIFAAKANGKANKASKKASDASDKAETAVTAAEGHAEQVSSQIKTNNGKTIGQYTELINNKIDLLSELVVNINNNVKDLDDKLDKHSDDVMEKMTHHERDDEERFQILENKLDSRLDL